MQSLAIDFQMSSYEVYGIFYVPYCILDKYCSYSTSGEFFLNNNINITFIIQDKTASRCCNQTLKKLFYPVSG